jgi:hypothetical protein
MSKATKCGNESGKTWIEKGEKYVNESGEGNN